MDAIELPAELWERVLVHARAALPLEAVGLLGGNERRVNIVIPLPNLAPQWTFLADPLAQYRAERELARVGAELLGIYHSHPGGGAQLSPCDLAFAAQRSCVHVVIALHPEGGGSEKMRAYSVENGRVRDVEIVIFQ